MMNYIRKHVTYKTSVPRDIVTVKTNDVKNIVNAIDDAHTIAYNSKCQQETADNAHYNSI